MKVLKDYLPSQHINSLKAFKAFCENSKPNKTYGADKLTLLHLACMFYDSVNLVDWLITTKGVWVHSVTKTTKKTALHCAVRKGSIRVVKCLIEKHKANQHAVRSRKENCLFIATKRNHTELAEYLLARGVDPHVKSTTDTNIVLLAAQNGNFRLLKLYKNVGVSLHAINDKSENALMLAAKAGCLESVKLLVEEGVCTVGSVGEENLLHYAKDHHDVLLWILNNTAWQKLRTAQILLDLKAPTEAFGSKKLSADLVLEFDRADLLKNVPYSGDSVPEKLLVKATGDKTKTYLEELCRWRRIRGSLLLWNRKVSLLARLSGNLFRELFKLL
mmetsp:Transcript_25473/g.44321  ORF Transcript_25473/g.44321 Transcript_25473/m.44321 type:complete len:331 (+) Transcript_25473:6995-7987(+)